VGFTQIRYEVAGGVATVTLDRPAQLNALTMTMLAELREVFDRIDADDGVRAVIVTGAGSAFCAGADLSGGGDTFDAVARGRAASAETARDEGGLLTLRIFDLKKPVIAAINGPAVGFGITVTLPMDIRIASTAARIGFVFVRRGIVPESASSWFLPRLVGMGRAAEWVLTGRVFPAEEALAGGLVTRVVPPAELLPAARGLAEEIARHTAPVAVALSRQLLWKMAGASHPAAAHRIDSRAMFWTGRSADVREGIAAFLAKREPRFTLRPSADMPPFYPWWETPGPPAPPEA
jgi:enoyl-CoA hydratase/carnithine racemase